ncbi:endonuclease/exonuclease/phosphatase family protein [Kitasatospora albolonga]|uniref:endonuclease/exonuclease/phosphatase family protein n=1 Tax=Kitasatospora albolonga TaxID=68173 RepID=UPI0031EBDC52
MTQVDTRAPVRARKAPQPSSPPARRKNRWRRGRILAGLAVLTALVTAGHSLLPDGGNLGGFVETFLPWSGLLVLALLLGALLRRSATALVATALPGAVWLAMYGGALADGSSGKGDLTVVSHNVAAANVDYAGTLKVLKDSGADLIALQEMESAALGEYRRGLASAYPYYLGGSTTDGLWSKYPIVPGGFVEKDGIQHIGTAARAVVETPKGRVAVYYGHLDSVRVTPRSGFGADPRNESVKALSAALRSEPEERVLLMGDLNGSLTDRAFDPLTEQLTSAQETAGQGFGFTFPAAFPMVRIDHVLSGGKLTATDSWLLPRSGSDHRAVAASFKL